MKRSLITILVLALLLTCLAGCGRMNDNETVDPTPAVDDGNVRPEDNNGVVGDNNGIIGDSDQNGNNTNEGILPEIGNDIEDGADDIIDGVGNAIEGNDNNAASNNTNSDAGDNARGRMRTR